MQNISFHCWFGDRQKWYAAGRIPSAKKKKKRFSAGRGAYPFAHWWHLFLLGSPGQSKNSFVHNDISNGDLKTTISCQSAFLSGMRFWRNSRISFQVRLLYLNYVNGSQGIHECTARLIFFFIQLWSARRCKYATGCLCICAFVTFFAYSFSVETWCF